MALILATGKFVLFMTLFNYIALPYVIIILLWNILESLDKTKEREEAILYTWNHKKAFLKVEKILFGKNILASYLHDIEKMFLYAIFGDKKWIQKFHRRINKHHVEYWDNMYKKPTEKWIKQMIVDFECARVTKPDKPLNWESTILVFYNDKLNIEDFYNVLSKEKYEELKKEIDKIKIR